MSAHSFARRMLLPDTNGFKRDMTTRHDTGPASFWLAARDLAVLENASVVLGDIANTYEGVVLTCISQRRFSSGLGRVFKCPWQRG